jgi:hypothetical protein
VQVNALLAGHHELAWPHVVGATGKLTHASFGPAPLPRRAPTSRPITFASSSQLSSTS